VGELGQLGVLAVGSQSLIECSAGRDAHHVVSPAVKLADRAVANVFLPDQGGSFAGRVEGDVGGEVPTRCSHVTA
jgi:hypothetical protein